MVFVGLQPFGGERESVLADERRYGNGNPVGAWALMASAVARRDASAKPNGPGNALAQRDRRLAETGDTLVGGIAQHGPQCRSLPAAEPFASENPLLVEMARNGADAQALYGVELVDHADDASLIFDDLVIGG